VQNGGKNTNIFIVLLLILFLSTGTVGCKSGKRASRGVRDAEKVEAQMQKEEEKELEAARKRHYKMQSKQSHQLMKETKKQSKSANKGQQRSFWDRLFNRNCPG
jgi:hypothetical protein